ncbi:MAG: hypothetical protein QM233_08885 [Candidatus Cloacimonadota bacterium]|nr:hypothetical protein [Candidatus Cloacimonadota bacterium]
MNRRALHTAVLSNKPSISSGKTALKKPLVGLRKMGVEAAAWNTLKVTRYRPKLIFPNPKSAKQIS